MKYPLFRLSVFMAAGIFFFDTFLPDVPILWLLFPTIVSALLGWICSAFYFPLFFFLFGGMLVVNERKSVDFNWSEERMLYYGTVMTSSLEKGKTLCSEVRVDYAAAVDDSSFVRKGDYIPVDRQVLLYYMTDSISGDTFKYGDKVAFYSKISRPEADSDFMGFDYGNYLFRKGISGTGFAFSNAWRVCNEGNPELELSHRALMCRDKIIGLYSKWKLDDDVKAVVSALTIGDKSELTPEIKAVYSASGTSHVLALSGLHVGILSGILFFILYPLRSFRGGRFFQAVLVVVVLWIFAFVSGMSPSVVRAVTMCSLYLLASVMTEDRFSGFYSLVLTAFIMLIYQPFYLFDVSFQLSFLAVLSILLFYPVFSSWIDSRFVVVRYLWNALSVSMAAQLGTLPLVLYYFGAFPTYFLVANLVVGPLAVCILASALASVVLWNLPLAGNICIFLLNFFTSLLNESMLWVQQLWGAQITSVHINKVQVLLGFVMIWQLLVFINRRRAVNLMCLVGTACFMSGVTIWRQLHNEQPVVFLSRSDLYYRNADGEMKMSVSSKGIHRIDSLYIGVMNSGQWKNMKAEKKGRLDYVYITKGFSGNIKGLTEVFNIGMVVLDCSLSDGYRKYLVDECRKLNIPFWEVSDQGSFKILL